MTFRLGRLILVLAAMYLGASTVAAQTQSLGDAGMDGADGADGTRPGASGQDGGNGGNASAVLNSASFPIPPLTVITTATGGNGGDGGDGFSGASPGDGGFGGLGGGAMASSTVNAASGPVAATATATGGEGGNYGRGGFSTTTGQRATSGPGGYGGNASAGASATTASADPVTVDVTARGGQGGRSSRGFVDGGNATITLLNGTSAGGDVTINALAAGGKGGTGFPNDNDIFVGAGGRAGEALIINVADANTSGRINITQNALAGQWPTPGSGNGFSGGGFPPGDGSLALSYLELPTSKTAADLRLTSTAVGSDSGNDQYNVPGADGGRADSRVFGINLGGDASGTATASGGSFGDIVVGMANVGQTIRFGNGGRGVAMADVTGLQHANAVATAGGGGGGMAPANGLVLGEGGIGGRGEATARATTAQAGGQANATANAYGGTGGADFTTVGYVPLSRAGAAEALAEAIAPGGNANSTAVAFSGGGLRAGNAVAEALATGDRGTIRADATSTDRYDSIEADLQQTNFPGTTFGQAHLAAGTGFNITPAPVPTAAQSSLNVQARRGGLFNFDLQLVNDPSANGQMQYEAEMSMSFDQSRGLPASAQLDFTSFNVIGAGFDELTFSFQLGNGPVIGPPTFTDPVAAQTFFSAPLFLGTPTVDTFGKFKLKVMFEALISSGGIASVAADGNEPLPGFGMGMDGNGFSLTSVTAGPALPPEFETDVDFDGDVDGADFLILQRIDPDLIPQWKTEYGQSAAPPAIAFVPEPTAAALLLAMAVPYVAIRHRSVGRMQKR